MLAAGASQSLVRAGLAALCGIVTRNARPALAPQAQHTHLQRRGQVPLAGWRAQQLRLSANSLRPPHLAAATAHSCAAQGTSIMYCLPGSGCTATSVGLAVLPSTRAQLTAGCSSLCKHRQMCLHVVFRSKIHSCMRVGEAPEGARLGCLTKLHGTRSNSPAKKRLSGESRHPPAALGGKLEAGRLHLG